MSNLQWWKILGILLFLYVLIAGLLIPLNPGVLRISPASVAAGSSVPVVITGYNSHYNHDPHAVDVWMRIDSTFGVVAKSVQVNSDRELIAHFDIPNLGSDKNVNAALLVHNQLDGTSIFPAGGLSITPVSGGSITSLTQLPYDLFSPKAGLNFPFRSILYESIRNLFFHVAIWMAMFVLLIMALYHSIQVLRTESYHHDLKASAFTKVSIVYGLIGLVTGSMWARYTWGAWWVSNEIKLNMSAIAVLIYVAYAILRSSLSDQDQRAKVSAAYNIFAFVAMIPLIFIIPRLNQSMHPGSGGNPALGGEDLDNSLRLVFYPAILGLTLIGFWMTDLKYRYEHLWLRSKDLIDDTTENT